MVIIRFLKQQSNLLPLRVQIAIKTRNPATGYRLSAIGYPRSAIRVASARVVLDFALVLHDHAAASATGYDLVLPGGGPTKRSD
jgi:hypothetical protein